MYRLSKERKLSEEEIAVYLQFLQEQEKSSGTLEKYRRDLHQFFAYFQERELDKGALLEWKAYLQKQYHPSSVNGKLTTVNGFFTFYGRYALRMKLLKIQKEIFSREEKELSRTEYGRLVGAAEQKGNERLALVIQTICATGIRVSELQYITVEAVCRGRAEVNCKGKRRIIFLPVELQKKLKGFLKRNGIREGVVFRTKTGNPLNRSNIWADMKKLCRMAHVEPSKVFPHNLRHLFARTFYSIEKDIAKLADLLGHSSVETTRIYIMESGREHRKKLEKMRLVL